MSNIDQKIENAANKIVFLSAYCILLSKYQTDLNIMLGKTVITFPAGKNNELR